MSSVNKKLRFSWAIILLILSFSLVHAKVEFTMQTDEKKLKTMLKVFLYSSDLDNARKVAEIAYKRNKQSLFWNQKMADIAKWSGRTDEAFKYMSFLYKKRPTTKLRDTLISYALADYQYEAIEYLVAEKALQEPTKENIMQMIFLHEQIGYPEKSAQLLEKAYRKDRSKSIYLTMVLKIYLEIGDFDATKRIINMINKAGLRTTQTAELEARFYYLKHDMTSAYKALLLKDKAEGSDKYYQLLSDFSWYMQDRNNALKASIELFKKGSARLVDYQRIVAVYSKNDAKIALNAVKSSYEKHRKAALFYTYADKAMEYNLYDDLDSLFEWAKKNKLPLYDDQQYWLIKSKIYAHNKQSKQEKEALLHAMKLGGENKSTSLKLLWFFIQSKNSETLKNVLQDLHNDPSLVPSFYFPMASAYFNLNDINKAAYYLDKLIKRGSSETKQVEFKFLKAYIYQAQNRQEAFKMSMQEIVDELKVLKKQNPKLKKDSEFLSAYLRASLFVLHPDSFEKKLHESKRYLSQKLYDDLSYSWAVYHHEYEKSLEIFHKMATKDLWIRFSQGLIFQEHTKISSMLDTELKKLSLSEAANAAYLEGEFSLAESLNFEVASLNDESQAAYLQHLDLVKASSDTLDIKSALLQRSPLTQKLLQVHHTNKLGGNYSYDLGFDYAYNKTEDSTTLFTVPKSTIKGNMALRKKSKRSLIELDLDFHHAMEDYAAFSFRGDYHLSTDLYTTLKMALNHEALESSQLMLAGKKDLISLELSWKILSSSTITLLQERNSYFAQDNTYLGEGDYTRLIATQQIRLGYPDIKYGAFYDRGSYWESSGSHGTLDKLQPTTFGVLPEDFENMGLIFSYGMANRVSYTRVWRPYFELTPYKNQVTGDYTLGFNVGLGGKVWHQDHLSIGASYSKSISGIDGNIFELYIDYKFLYYN
jgi:polysaccharide biosynthesis protein PelB